MARGPYGAGAWRAAPMKLAGVDVSLAVEPGTSVALLGHNGAGKTTLTRMLMGLVRPRAGRVSVGGATFDRTLTIDASALELLVRRLDVRHAVIDDRPRRIVHRVRGGRQREPDAIAVEECECRRHLEQQLHAEYVAVKRGRARQLAGQRLVVPLHHPLAGLTVADKMDDVEGLVLAACGPSKAECTDAIGCVDIAPGDPIHIAYALTVSGATASAPEPIA